MGRSVSSHRWFLAVIMTKCYRLICSFDSGVARTPELGGTLTTLGKKYQEELKKALKRILNNHVSLFSFFDHPTPISQRFCANSMTSTPHPTPPGGYANEF